MIPIITIQGNLTADPEYRTTQSGKLVANLRIAANDSKYDERSQSWVQSDVLFLTVVAWEPLAQNLQASNLAKGSPVIVTGRLRSRQWEDDNRQKHTATELVATDMGFSFRRGTASFTKTGSTANGTSYGTGYGTGHGTHQADRSGQDPAGDPWGGQPFGPSSVEPDF